MLIATFPGLFAYKMYQGRKSSIRYNDNQSICFPNFKGGRHGENLSPLFFALFALNRLNAGLLI